jgi:cyclic beta-1,2-glucan synthetase
MVDNLRRSLTAPASLLLALAAWTLPGVSPLLWTGLFVGAIAVPSFIPVLDGLVPQRWGISKRSHLRAVAHDLLVALAQASLALSLLAHQAWLHADAVIRTLVRLQLTRRNLLEWTPAQQAEYGADLRLSAFYRHMAGAVVVSAATALLVAAGGTGAWGVAAPFVLLWALSPLIAWRISRPPKPGETQILSQRETRTLRLIARRTWRFFETFVVEAENFLPPDNFQEDPEPVIAHRTSPTNIGLYLLTTTVAHDFGTIGVLDMAKRLEETLETMARLRQHRGHLFNWYDTQDLRPLDPVYVSTVDSGNLAGHLIAVAQACHERMQRPLFGPETLEGIRDALELLRGAKQEAAQPRRAQTVTETHLHEAAESLELALEAPPASHEGWGSRLAELATKADTLLDIARTLCCNFIRANRGRVGWCE